MSNFSSATVTSLGIADFLGKSGAAQATSPREAKTSDFSLATVTSWGVGNSLGDNSVALQAVPRRSENVTSHPRQ